MLAERLRNHRLTGPGLPGPVEVIRWFGAVQSQDFAGALWALAQRIDASLAVSEDDLLAAFDAGAFVRTHILRPTWHVVAPADLRWMLALSAPRVQAACAGGYRRLDIDTRTRLRAEGVLQRALEGERHPTRHELAAALRRARIATDDQRLVYLLIHAELEGLICSGPRRGTQFTYALLDERVPATPPLGRDTALARLMTRYFEGRGPATLHDAAWWAGLTLRDVREGIALAGDALERRVIEDREYWQGRDSLPGRPSASSRSGGKSPGPSVHLLPNFDEYTVAYRDRAALLHPSVPVTSTTQSALLSQPVMVDGRGAGTWSRLRSPARGREAVTQPGQRGHLAIAATVHSSLSPAQVRALERAAGAYGRFLRRSVSVAIR